MFGAQPFPIQVIQRNAHTHWENQVSPLLLWGKSKSVQRLLQLVHLVCLGTWMESCDTGCQRVILPCHHSNQGPGVSELTISRTSPLNFRDQDFCSVLDFKMFLAVPMMLHYGYDLNEFICNTCLIRFSASYKMENACLLCWLVLHQLDTS